MFRKIKKLVEALCKTQKIRIIQKTLFGFSENSGKFFVEFGKFRNFLEYLKTFFCCSPKGGEELTAVKMCKKGVATATASIFNNGST